MTQTELAHRIKFSDPRVNEIVKGRRSISPNTAPRLANLFRTCPEFWLKGHRNWVLRPARRSPA